jgi:hypothetical protein
MRSKVTRGRDMPYQVLLLVILGFSAPFLAFFAVWTGSVFSNLNEMYAYGAAKTLLEVLIVVAFSLPIAVASALMVRGVRNSIFLYLVGWVAICMAPMTLSSFPENHELFLIELSVYLVIGALLALYLFRSKKVSSYFH